MSVNALNKALRIVGCNTGPGGDYCAHGLRSTASTLLNEEGAFDGDVVEVQTAHDTEKKAPAARRGGAASAYQGRQEQDPRGIYSRAAYWAERVRLTQHWSDRVDSLRDGAPAVSLRRSTA
jgi:hypothetical protein